MSETTLKNRRLIALSLLGGVLLNYPILSLFNLNLMLMGIPLLYLYIFIIWTVLIILIALATTSGSVTIYPPSGGIHSGVPKGGITIINRHRQ